MGCGWLRWTTSLTPGLVKRLLEERGARVRVAASASEAMELIRCDPPDVLVSDIGMPGEDGMRLSERWRAG